MVDAIVSVVLEQLISMAVEESKENVKLVTGVGNEVKKLTSNLRAIKAVLNDAEKRQMKEETVRFWLDQLKDASYDMEDVLDEWNTARQKLRIEGVDDENALVPQKMVCSFFPVSCFGFKRVVLSRDIAIKIKQINETLDDIVKRKDMFNFDVNVYKSSTIEKPERVQTTSVVDESEIFGREYEKSRLINKLLCEVSDEQNGLPIISLVGLGGIGKTTLAQLAYNDDQVIRNFDKRIWVCVSEPFDEFRIARAIIEALKGSASNLGEFQSLIQHVQERIEGKKFLLVLDDVWNENYNKWEPLYHCLKNGLHGSKILITTRKETVAQIMGSIDLISIKELAENECWSMFEKLVFFGRSNEKHEKLEKIGRKIVGKCKGLPLAAKIIGSLLRSKNKEEEWQNILESEMWELEEIEKGLLAPLLLSYNDLPAMVKQCFSYCAIFPKDYVIEKDKLIQLWMAQGYINEKSNKEMEIIGEEYFEILARRSFFQEFIRIGDGTLLFRIHDVVHDLAQFVSKSECLTVEMDGREESYLNSFGEKFRHLMVTLGEGASFPIPFCAVKRLRSLLIRVEAVDSLSLIEVLPKLFDELICLRALDIGMYLAPLHTKNILKEIPPNIEKLVHLRYLNLSYQKMEKLPETLCELFNLQLLNIQNCQYLKELPQGIGKLINLRYLLNSVTESLRCLPAGIERLTSLRRVENFVVGGGVEGREICSLESLRNLNHLRNCRILGLGEVSDAGVARRSELEKKKNLITLSLCFDRDDEEARRRNDKDEQVLEGLKPPPNLKHLVIEIYEGNTISSRWTMSLTNLVTIHLNRCINCEHLPPLGKLPSLEILLIFSMPSVKRVGNEFLGIESDICEGSSVIAFPKLKKLEMLFMDELEEWDYGITIKGEIMTRLSSLTLNVCPKLRALPDHLLQTTTLQQLLIWYCPNLVERYRNEAGEVWPKISHIPNISIDGKCVKGGLEEFSKLLQSPSPSDFQGLPELIST